MLKIACEMNSKHREVLQSSNTPNLKFCLSSSKEKKEVAYPQAMEEKSSFHPFDLIKTQ